VFLAARNVVVNRLVDAVQPSRLDISGASGSTVMSYCLCDKLNKYCFRTLDQSDSSSRSFMVSMASIHSVVCVDVRCSLYIVYAITLKLFKLHSLKTHESRSGRETMACGQAES
jgi:hypothetical protein